MEITNVQIYPVENHEKLKAYAHVTIDDCFIVRDLKVIYGTKGLFVSMPNKKYRDEFKEIAHPLNTETREKFHRAVIDRYKEEIS